MITGGSTESELQRNGGSEAVQQKAKKAKHRLLRWKWKEGVILACQLLAYTACNVAMSLMGPFFPGVVITID